MSKRSRKRPSKKDNHKIFKKDYNNRDFLSSISPETKKAIFVFLILIVGFLSFLSLFDLSGAIGKYILFVMKIFVGWLYFLIPIVIIVLGYLSLNPGKYRIDLRHYIGIVLWFLSSTGFLNLILKTEDIIPKLKEGSGGGFLGMIFYWPIFKLAGFWGSFIILIGLFFISLFLTFNLSMKDLHLAEKFRSLFILKKEKIDDVEIGYEEDEVYVDKKKIINTKDVERAVEEKILIKEDSSNLEKIKSELMPLNKKIYKDIKIPMDLLSDQRTSPVSRDIESSKEKIKRTLANFNINVEMGEVNVGPTVTQFTLKPDESVKLSKISTLQDNLALSLAAHPLRIEAPIPGKSLVGIEVPNKVVSVVRLKEILSDPVFKNSDGHLVFALGKDVSGNRCVVDLVKMPHLLIAGATGSGKSVAINSLIVSLLYRLNPNELRLIMVDPKRVELSPYNGIPHLLTPVITKVDKTVNALKWAVAEMDRRYELLSSLNKKDIYLYNKSRTRPEDKLPNIIIIIDELADLMAVSPQEVESAIIRLAQMARAVGIHLVLATQRPSVNVITGLIKANITSRIAFAVASQIDSRTVLDASGAEKLLGKGDMLFTSAEYSKPRRVQGVFISEDEKERVIDYLKEQAEPEYLENVTENISTVVGFGGRTMSGDQDSLLAEAKAVVMRSDKASATLLQRRLRVGYARAARILDELEEIGVVGPANGAKPRDVLVTEENGVLDAKHYEDDSSEDDLMLTGQSQYNRNYEEEIDDYEDIDQEEIDDEDDFIKENVGNELERQADDLLERNEIIEEDSFEIDDEEDNK
ncbi:MAG: DNA translocase FtsK 4TM domain-containing protein [Patescibacteria group bacterium]|nr:DNA translocase FtsK 4TM domain-containing protein [Patescibacteria group bacterium]MDD4304652.1 DNA translocase FtsK 4TM domain-containing protein [Patescibacteria group bacterium]MDD4695707.1 DNA translocase FtsK 4TM domain-containing protein [Patescibacteria group bacterium]